MKESPSIPARFEEIAARFPDRPAVSTAQGSLSYDDLNRRANRLAHAIIHLTTAAPGQVVLLFEQGVEAIIATMATLKSGHAFVPLDASDGSDRMRGVIRDCEPVAIVTDSDHLSLAAELAPPGVRIIHMDEPGPDLSDENPVATIPPTARAYIFYTSGSTGKPKGVCQTHRNLLHFVSVYSESLGIRHDDRLTLLYSPAFSASNMDVFGALLNGAALYPYPIKKLGTASLAKWLCDHSITILHAVPTVFRHLVKGAAPEQKFDGIRGIDLGGESMHPGDMELHRKHFRPDCVFLNHLAATEASVIAQHPIDVHASYPGDMLPVGMPAEGMEIRILKPDGSEAATGEDGDIVLHSPYISPGYWKRPDLDAKAFGQDPDRPGWRTYRSGDLGHFGEDGNLYFLGRRDHRVKVRGHTVDTSEIEAAIHGNADIRDVAVVVRKLPDSDEEEQLTAFLAGIPQGGTRPGQLRATLRKQLPPYMIPAEFIVLDSLPATSSGKIDRLALSQIVLREERGDAPFEPPANEIETVVAAFFGNILKLDGIGRSDDFFSLGGDSLKATLLHAHLENHFKTRVPLEKLFPDSTVSGISGLIGELRDSGAGNTDAKSVLVPLRETGSKPKLFLLHGAQGQAFVSPHFLKIIGEDQPLYAFQANGLDRDRGEHRTIGNMAGRYIEAMRSVQEKGPYLIGALCVGYVLALEMALQLEKAGEKVAPLILIDPPIRSIMEFRLRKRIYKIIRNRWRNAIMPFTTGRKFNTWMRERAGEGRIQIDASNPDSLKAALKVTLDFEMALHRYKPADYHGPVHVLGTEKRWGEKCDTSKSVIRRRLTGPVTISVVGETHVEVHDVSNGLFAEQLRKTLRESIAAIQPAGVETD